jgi:hypothetical protein
MEAAPEVRLRDGIGLHIHGGAFAEPSDGLEPSTPSLPCAPTGNRSQPAATVWLASAVFGA